MLAAPQIPSAARRASRKAAPLWLPHPNAGKKRLILRCWYSLGDIVLLTAAVRGLHRCHPGKFLTDLRTPFDELWLHNPHVTPLRDKKGEVLECDYALIEESNTAPYHAIHSFTENLATQLGVRIRPAIFKGDIHLHPLEKAWTPQVAEKVGEDVPYWIIVAGGKTDVTIKWWAPDRWQAVVDHFQGKILFVQAGAKADRHPALHGVLDLRGKTGVRQLVRLVHHSIGVLCPVTSLMHLAAAVPPRTDRPKNRACVVVAGGREPVQWEAYPHHQFLHTLGTLPCCDNGGCWKARTVPLGDGDQRRDTNLCVDPVRHGRGRNADVLPRCMSTITPGDVFRAIERYHEADVCQNLTARQRRRIEPFLTGNRPVKTPTS